MNAESINYINRLEFAWLELAYPPPHVNAESEGKMIFGGALKVCKK